MTAFTTPVKYGGGLVRGANLDLYEVRAIVPALLAVRLGGLDALPLVLATQNVVDGFLLERDVLEDGFRDAILDGGEVRRGGGRVEGRQGGLGPSSEDAASMLVARIGEQVIFNGTDRLTS